MTILEEDPPIIMPLIDVEMEEEKEVKLYTTSFVDKLENRAGSPFKRTSIKRKQAVMEEPQRIKTTSKPLNID
jgi:hypothetical protein